MVLHHVAQRAGGVIIPGPPSTPKALRHGNLHMVDMRGVPERLEQAVGETQRHEVLHRLFAEVMVDPVHPVFRKHLADRVIHRPRGIEAFADRLFHHDARIRACETKPPEPLADHPEQRRARSPDRTRSPGPGKAAMPRPTSPSPGHYQHRPSHSSAGPKTARAAPPSVPMPARSQGSPAAPSRYSPPRPSAPRETPIIAAASGNCPAMSR